MSRWWSVLTWPERGQISPGTVSGRSDTWHLPYSFLWSGNTGYCLLLQLKTQTCTQKSSRTHIFEWMKNVWWDMHDKPVLPRMVPLHQISLWPEALSVYERLISWFRSSEPIVMTYLVGTPLWQHWSGSPSRRQFAAFEWPLQRCAWCCQGQQSNFHRPPVSPFQRTVGVFLKAMNYFLLNSYECFNPSFQPVPHFIMFYVTCVLVSR